jgi:hypothetical protein
VSNWKDWEYDIPKIDYYVYFIKSWIAFNSWYREKCPNIQDRQIIDKIKKNSDFKTLIKNFLDNNYTDNNESSEFKKNISNLHLSLEQSCITYELEETKISFENIRILNKIDKIDEKYRTTNYFIERKKENKIEIKIGKKKSKLLLHKTQEKYDIEELKNYSEFEKLSKERKDKLCYFYKEISPCKFESILNKNERDFLQLEENIKFINDIDKISVAIIEILYLLRCSLFHGDFSPNETTNLVYKYAYEILKSILNKLK